MFKLIAFTLLLLPMSAFSQTILVEYGHNIYSLEMSENEIRFQKKEHVAIVTKQPCSTNLFNDFKTRFSALTNLPEDKVSGAEFLVKYKVGDKEGIQITTHPYSQVLLSIPKQFDIFKLATEYRCKKGSK